MVELRIKMRSGESFAHRLNGSIQDARQMIADRPFLDLSHENGFVVLNVSDVSLVACVEILEEQASANEPAKTLDEAIASA